MKYFICLLALVAIYGNQVDSSSATWRIDSEAKADQNRMKVQILTEGAKVKNRIKLRTEGYIEDFLSLTSEMDDRLARRSSAGEVISTKLKVRFMQAINDLKATFSEQMTKPEIKNIVESLKRECIDAFKQDIDTIKVAVEDKRRVIKCWDSYRKDSRANYDATIQTIVDTVDSKTDEIDDKATALKKQFKDALEKIEADNTCGSDDECTEKYVSHLTTPTNS